MTHSGRSIITTLRVCDRFGVFSTAISLTGLRGEIFGLFSFAFFSTLEKYPCRVILSDRSYLWINNYRLSQVSSRLKVTKPSKKWRGISLLMFKRHKVPVMGFFQLLELCLRMKKSRYKWNLQSVEECIRWTQMIPVTCFTFLRPSSCIRPYQ